MQEIVIGSKRVGSAHPVFVIAEIGINHNGSLDVAKQLIEGAALAGCDAVKSRKEPRISVCLKIRGILNGTPPGAV